MSIYTHIKIFFSPPQLEDEEQFRIARILNASTIAILIGLFTLLIYRQLTGQIRLFLPLLIMCSIALVSIGLVRKGFIRWSASLMSWSILGFLNYLIVVNDGIHDSAVLALPGVLVLGGLVLRKRYFLVYITASLVSICMIGYLEINGYIHNMYFGKTAYHDILDIIVILCITAVTVRLLSDNLFKSLSLARENEKALQEQAVQLTESEKKYRALFEGANDAIFIMNSEIFLQCNEMTIEMFGCSSRSDIVGHSPWEFSPTQQPDGRESKEKAIEVIHSAIQGAPQRFYWQHPRKDGSLFDAEVSLSSVKSGNDVFIQALVRNITERKQADDILRENETLLRETQTIAGLGSYTLNTKTGIWKSSEVLDAIFGIDQTYSRTIEGWTEIIHPDDRKQMSDYFNSEVLGKSIPFDREYRIIRKNDSAVRWVHGNGRLEVDTNDTIVKMLGTIIDITERKHLEATLRESEERFRNVFEHAAVGKSMTSLDGKVIINNAFCEILGYSQKELSSLNWQTITHPEDVEHDQKIFDSMISGERSSAHWEKRYLHKNGKIVWVDISSTVQFDKAGIAQYFITTINDISERKRAEEALRESEAQYSHLIETMQDGVYRSSHEGKFLEINPAMVKILGYDSKEELMAIDIKSELYFDVQDRESAALDEKLQEMAIFRLRKKDGSEIWVEDHGQHVVDSEGKVKYHEGVLRDISERMQAENALRASEAELRSLFTAMNDVVLIMDNEGRYLKIAPTNPSLLYKPSEELLGKKVHEIFPKDQADFFVKHIRLCLETKTIANVDYNIKLRDKDIFFYATVSPLTDNSVIWVARDITDRKLAVDALRESEEQYRNVVTVSPDAIVIHCEGKIVYANPAAIRLVGGISPDDVIGKSPLLFVHPDERELISKRILSLSKGEIPSSWLEERFIKLDGSVIYVEVISVSTPYQSKPAVQVVVRDITERKRAEKELTTLAHALKSIRECVSITDIENNIIFLNQAFTKTYGYEESELKGKNINVIQSPNNPLDLVNEILPETIRGGWHGELLNKRKDGTEFSVLLSTSVIRGDTGELLALIGVATDLTDYKFEEEKRKSLEIQLQQSQKLESLGTLASGIAHDFNNILGIILGHASILEGIPVDTAIIKKSSTSIIKAGKRGASLVKQLLTFARKTDILVESVRLNDIVIEVSKLLSETFPRTIIISLNLEHQLPSIIADATQIHQVILNLCVNARDAMPKGGRLSISTSIKQGDHIRTKFPNAEQNEYAELRLSDTGIGMDGATLRRIYEPFFTTKDIGKGTGLGLSLVFGIVESHNGFIDVQSEPGKGTTFEIYFPLPFQLIEHEDTRDGGSTEIIGGDETILLIEDEELLRELLTGILEEKGYNILTAEDGERGVEQYVQHQQNIHLVLSDLGLPKINGFDAFKQMKEINSNIKFIIASGFIDPENKASMLESGMKSIIQKPYSSDELLLTIRKVLDLK